jgi:hypothetical protein
MKFSRRTACKFLVNSDRLTKAAAVRVNSDAPLSFDHRQWLLRLIAILDQQSAFVRDLLSTGRSPGSWPEPHASLSVWPDDLKL